MNRPFSFLTLLLVACAVGAGCNKKADIVGKWKLKDATGQSSAEMAQVKQAMNSIKAEFNEDHSFSLSMGVTVGGTYTFENGKASLTINKMNGTTVPNGTPASGTLSADGETLTIDPGAGKPGSLIFTRDASS